MAGTQDLRNWLEKNLKDKPEIYWSTDEFNTYVQESLKKYNQIRKAKGWKEIDWSSHTLRKDPKDWREYCQENFGPDFDLIADDYKDSVDNMDVETVTTLSTSSDIELLKEVLTRNNLPEELADLPLIKKQINLSPIRNKISERISEFAETFTEKAFENTFATSYKKPEVEQYSDEETAVILDKNRALKSWENEYTDLSGDKPSKDALKSFKEEYGTLRKQAIERLRWDRKEDKLDPWLGEERAHDLLEAEKRAREKYTMSPTKENMSELRSIWGKQGNPKAQASRRAKAALKWMFD